MKIAKLLLIATLTLSTTGLTGCAYFRASGARHAHIEAETKGFVYAQPLQQVWPKARQLLFESGYEVNDTDASNAETEWKRDGDYRSRYLLSGFDVEGGKSRVEFMKQDQQKDEDGGWHSADTERDLGMEWKLIKKVNPDRAKQIETEGDAKGEAAKAK